MKSWKCPHCARQHSSSDNIAMVVCPSCCDVFMEQIFSSFKTPIIIKNKVTEKLLKGGNIKHGKNKKFK